MIAVSLFLESKYIDFTKQSKIATNESASVQLQFVYLIKYTDSYNSEYCHYLSLCRDMCKV